MDHGAVISRSTVAAAAVLALLCAWGADAVWLNMPVTGTKCVSEEIQPNVVVLADYAVMYEGSTHGQPTIAIKVTSPYGNTLHHNENVTIGQFAFTTTESGNYLACFWMDSTNKAVGVSVNLDWKIGIAAKDWDSVAKKEKIEGVELELRKLEEAVEVIHNYLLYLKAREAEMREVSERTNARVAWCDWVPKDYSSYFTKEGYSCLYIYLLMHSFPADN
ncbi:transmembrane emp24 domain-containing protein p24delta3-like isoform X3 [Typha latifolia]|uniref:transmembrane emp24 domain-containing protein p24delta3-like isoform X3 n=1 Tax=Typha latifolia TaxID=4733 RepID=UPI003C2AB167